MAGFATLIVLWGLIGSTDRTGWRVIAWLVGVSTATYGVGSLVFPDVASASGTGWGVAAIAWGVGYLALTERRARRMAAESVEVDTLKATAGAGGPVPPPIEPGSGREIH